MDEFRQISTELWCLIYVIILFPGSLEHLLTNFLEFILGRSGLGLKMDKFHQISTELWSLFYVNFFFWALS